MEKYNNHTFNAQILTVAFHSTVFALFLLTANNNHRPSESTIWVHLKAKWKIIAKKKKKLEREAKSVRQKSNLDGCPSDLSELNFLKVNFHWKRAGKNELFVERTNHIYKFLPSYRENRNSVIRFTPANTTTQTHYLWTYLYIASYKNSLGWRTSDLFNEYIIYFYVPESLRDDIKLLMKLLYEWSF